MCDLTTKPRILLVGGESSLLRLMLETSVIHCHSLSFASCRANLLPDVVAAAARWKAVLRSNGEGQHFTNRHVYVVTPRVEGMEEASGDSSHAPPVVIEDIELAWCRPPLVLILPPLFGSGAVPSESIGLEPVRPPSPVQKTKRTMVPLRKWAAKHFGGSATPKRKSGQAVREPGELGGGSSSGKGHDETESDLDGLGGLEALKLAPLDASLGSEPLDDGGCGGSGGSPSSEANCGTAEGGKGRPPPWAKRIEITWNEGWSIELEGLAYDVRVAEAATRSSRLLTAFARVVDIPLGLWCPSTTQKAPAREDQGANRREERGALRDKAGNSDVKAGKGQ